DDFNIFKFFLQCALNDRRISVLFGQLITFSQGITQKQNGICKNLSGEKKQKRKNVLHNDPSKNFLYRPGRTEKTVHNKALVTGVRKAGWHSNVISSTISDF